MTVNSPQMTVNTYWEALKWPILSWVAVDVVILLSSYAEGITEMLTPAALSPILVAFGIWAGYRIVEFGGNYLSAIVAGLIVGAVCGVLIYVGLGGIRGLGLAEMWPMALFGFTFNIVGALIGGGFVLSRAQTAS